MKEKVKDIDWKEFHHSTKAGPNGQAMYTSFEDLTLLSDEQRKLITDFGGKDIKDLFTKIFTYDESIDTTPLDLIKGKYPIKRTKSCTRRISFIPDKECKTRVIGILDY